MYFPNHTQVPSTYIVAVELMLVHLIHTNASFLMHISGIITGLVFLVVQKQKIFDKPVPEANILKSGPIQ